MIKISKVIVNYPKNPKDMEYLQDKTMNVLAKHIVEKFPENLVRELIKKLEDNKSL